MSKYIMALDAGTTSSRCVLVRRDGSVAAMAQKEFTQYFPEPGWVEHDAEEIWETQLAVAQEAMKQVGAGPEDIAAIGIANQRETTVVWERATGKPVCRAIVWQCRRTAAQCEELSARGLDGMIREKTGLIIDAYFSATKLKWILDHVPGSRERAERGELLFGTIDTWLIYRLSGGRVHVTDYSNAARTMLFNINTLSWDEEILRELEIPRAMLPEAKPSSGIYGVTEPSLFGGEIPIAGAAGDQQAALFGQNCFEAGEAKNTYGTGCFLLMNTGEKPVFSGNGLLTTVAWGLDGRVKYAVEGSVFVAGALIQWLRDELGLIRTAAESEEAASSVEDTGGCYLVPAFTGLGAPYWDPYARGTIVGLTRGSTRGHIVRAALEAIAFEVCDVLEAMEADSGLSQSVLRVDGGASANNLLMQMQADLSGVPLSRPKCVETTALGAAFLAGLATGFWKDQDEIRRINETDRRFEPSMTEDERRKRRADWKRAVRCAAGWAEPEA